MSVSVGDQHNRLGSFGPYGLHVVLTQNSVVFLNAMSVLLLR